MNKPAWQERESLLALASILLCVAYAAHDHASTGYACIGIGIIAAGFAISRGLAKAAGK